jgi:hypothetical protein
MEREVRSIDGCYMRRVKVIPSRLRADVVSNEPHFLLAYFNTFLAADAGHVAAPGTS